MTDRELMQQALEALEEMGGGYSQNLIAALRERLAQPEPKADAHLFYAPGDVLICKESDERVVVKHGNTGPMQLANGKITLEWSDETYGEYTLEQVMDGFIREGYAPRIEQPEQEPVGLTKQSVDSNDTSQGRVDEIQKQRHDNAIRARGQA